MKKILYTILFTLTIGSAFAANPLTKVVDGLTDFFGNSVANLLFTVATVAFFASVIRFLYNRSTGKAGDALEDAKERLLWGAGALFVMFSIWGIVNFFQSALLPGGINSNTISTPKIIKNGQSPSNVDANNAPYTPAPPASGNGALDIPVNTDNVQAARPIQ